MSELPKVAIVGRPNVGKSSLFNRLVGKRIALVHNEPGVTRDRLYGPCDWNGIQFEVIDTGGLEPGDRASIRSHIHAQVDKAVAHAQAIVFVVDGQEGLSGLDQEAATLIRRKGRRVILVVNKIDEASKSTHAYEFAKLGMGDPIWVSCVHGLNIDSLLDAVVRELKAHHKVIEVDDEPVRVAIVGRPNVGKSSLINRLIDEERVLVDDKPGTTRDPVPVSFKRGKSNLTLIDTAGIRRSSKVDSPIEQISSMMARRALESSDIAVLVLDGTAGVQSQDQRVASLIQEQEKPVVIAVNKWDVLRSEEGARADWEDMLAGRLGFFSFAPRVQISALEGLGIDELIVAIERVAHLRKSHMTTGKLNSLIREAQLVHPPPTRKGKQLQIRYVSQLKNRVATFVFKVNDRKLVHFSYERHLERVLREASDFTGVPLKFVFREGPGKK
ncbi:MAG: ribosome biogenesis GTPase Der [Candidatus Wallbacteria bacterium]|nr:ribosome biogenesis GTPase Der [Candidatus Wallbacteria bacterium]